MLQHAFYNGVSTFAMVIYFFFIVYYIFCNGFYFSIISFHNFFIHFNK
jgi:hypothetical protein